MLFKVALSTLLLVGQWLCCLPAEAQLAPGAPNDTVLKQIILFGRHGVRSPVLPTSKLATFASSPYPDFGIPPGYLTRHGREGEVLLGRYFRAYLLAEGLLTGNDREDARHVYFRANSIQRSIASAMALGDGLLPDSHPEVHSYRIGQPDPVFDPIAAKTVTFDSARVAEEVSGIYGAGGVALSAAYRHEFSLIRSALFGHTASADLPPAVPADHTDPTALPIPLSVSTSNVVTGNVIDTGGLINTLYAADPFIMEYAEGMSFDQVAWGRLTSSTLSKQTRIITLLIAVEMSTPYLNRVTSLLHLHWLLPGYQPDYCPPGASLIVELRQSKSSGHFVVRAYFVAQTLDQLRELIKLSVDHPPARMKLLIPGGANRADDLDVPFDRFVKVMERAIDLKYVQRPANETPPQVLHEAPMAKE